MKQVAIIDYNLGNLFSVKNACSFLGMNVIVTSDPQDVVKAEAIILPGVGAFNEGMCNLDRLGLSEVIKSKVKNGTPLFGICLGLQMLFTDSYEFGHHKGLGLIEGSIAKFPNHNEGLKLSVPFIGWNTLSFPNTDLKSRSPLSEFNSSDSFYFVHSYYASPQNNSLILSNTTYNGFKYCSSIHDGNNIFATQFHPEKSGKLGISIYKKWAIENKLI